MLCIYMLRCSSFLQVKCNWNCMGTIVLTVKRNNFKTPLPEAASRLILRKNCSSNPTTNLQGKCPTKAAFTPTKFAKQSYWSKTHYCAFMHRVARSGKQLSQRKQTEEAANK